MNIISMCETPGILRVIMILGYLIKFLTIITPIIIIITSISNLFKIVVNGSEDDLKKMIPITIKKIIAGLIIFIIPSIITFAYSLIGEELYELNLCVSNANLETIEYYEKLTPVENKLRTAEANPTANNLEKARKAIMEASSYAKEDTMLDYLQRLSQAEVNATKFEDIKECRAKGGTYDNGYCYVPPPPPPKEDSSSNSGGGNSGTSYDPSQGGTGMTDYGDYYVVATRASVESYLNIVSSNRIAQNNNTDLYGSKCLSFAYTHAYSLYSGDTSARAKEAAAYTHASYFTSYDNDNKQVVLENVYNELINGRPCLIQVNGNKAGTSRHYVTVVGFKKSVSSASSIQEGDLLIIDSWDGRLEKMAPEGSRFMVTGAACHKKYSGYQMYYLK